MIKELEFRGNRFKIWYVEDYATHPTWYTYEDEKDVREAFWDVKPGDVVFDVGACCGSYSFTALACGASKVFAWVPGKLAEGIREWDVMRETASLNNWLGRVYILPTGLHSKRTIVTEGSVTFQVSPMDDDGVPEYWSLRNVERIDWIKIDVEGAELEVLKGGVETISRHKPKLLIEHHLFARETMLEDVRAFLEPLGYRYEGGIKHPVSNVVNGLYVPAR